MKKLLALVAAVLLVATPVYAYHTETQTPYGINISVDNETGEIELTWQESDALEVNPPEYYRLFFGDDDQAGDFSIDTSFGFNEALSWRTYYFTPEYIYEKFETTTLTFYAKIQARNDTGDTVSDYTAVVCVEYDYDYVPNTTTSSSSTTTPTTLPAAEDVVEDNITTYLAWDEYGCPHPNNPLSYKQYLEAVESGDWFGYQPDDCTNVPDSITIIVEEEEYIDELDEEILRDDITTEDTIQDEEVLVEPIQEVTEEERLEAEEELLILEELEDSVIILEDLSEEEIQEFVDVIQEIEDTIELVEIVEEIIELDIPEDIIVVIIEEEIEEIIEEQITEDVVVDRPTDLEPREEEVIEELTEEEIQVEVQEIEEVITLDIPEVIEEELTEEETIEYEEAKEEAIQEFVQELETEEVIEVLEEVNDIGVQELKEVSEEVQEVIQAVVEEAIDNVEELTQEQVEVVAEVLQVETEDVAIVAEAIKQDEVVAEAVTEYVERAIENADVENYTLADVVTEVQYEAFLENPIEIFVDVDVQDINLSTIGDDMTQDQREKAQEVVVPVILTRIASMAALIFRKSL